MKAVCRELRGDGGGVAPSQPFFWGGCHATHCVTSPKTVGKDTNGGVEGEGSFYRCPFRPTLPNEVCIYVLRHSGNMPH